MIKLRKICFKRLFLIILIASLSWGIYWVNSLEDLPPNERLVEDKVSYICSEYGLDRNNFHLEKMVKDENDHIFLSTTYTYTFQDEKNHITIEFSICVGLLGDPNAGFMVTQIKNGERVELH